MVGVHPVVRYLIVCDDVVVDQVNPRKVTIVGLISTVLSNDDPPFPVRHEQLCVYAQLTEFRGVAQVRVDIVHADTESPVSFSLHHEVSFGDDPLDVVGAVIRLRGCRFPVAVCTECDSGTMTASSLSNQFS